MKNHGFEQKASGLCKIGLWQLSYESCSSQTCFQIQAESWSDTELNSYLTMIAEPGQADEAFKKICVYVMHKFYDVVKEKATACATAITRTTNAVNTLLKHFEDYTEEAAMDQNFYLWVD